MMRKKVKTEASILCSSLPRYQVKVMSKKSLQPIKPERVREKKPTEVRKSQLTVTTVGSPSSTLNYAHKQLIGKSKSKVNRMSQQWRSSLNTSVQKFGKEHYSASENAKNNPENVTDKHYNSLLQRSMEVLKRYESDLRSSREQNRLLRKENAYLKKLHNFH